MDKFTEGYIECALWASTDDNDEPLDRNASELSSDAREAMAKDCQKFQADNRALLDEAIDDYHRPDEYLGHDFWLTRNRHGTGFWDRGFNEVLSKALTDAAHKCGEASLFIDDNGAIQHFNG